MRSPDLTQEQTSVLRRLADEAEIRDLGHRFADACNRRDVAAFRELWFPDCVWVIDHPVNVRAEGVEAVLGTLESLASLWDWFVQLPHAPLVRVDGERATSSWTVSEHAAHAEPARRYDNHARYDDQLVRTEDGWRYRSRHYQYYWIDQDGV
jgi:ketosteroid isomerase-like protein